MEKSEEHLDQATSSLADVQDQVLAEEKKVIREQLLTVLNKYDHGNHSASLNTAVNFLAHLTTDAARQVLLSFQSLEIKKSKSELFHLRQLQKTPPSQENDRTLENHIRSLHQPAIMALADAGLWTLRFSTAKTIRAANLRYIDIIKNKKSKGGRPSPIRPMLVADYLAKLFFELRGKEPGITTKTYVEQHTVAGDFYEMLGDVYKTLRFDVNTEYYARKSIWNFKDARK